MTVKIQHIGGETNNNERLTSNSVSDIVQVKNMSVNNMLLHFRNNIERVKKHSI